MSAKSEVPVYYLDQPGPEHGPEAEAPCRVDSRDECRRLKREGVGFFICHGRAFRLYEKTPVVEAFLPPSGCTAPSTISYKEVRANVGITEETERYPERVIRAAREKIWVYPYIGDTQAPLASRACS
jgi:hypothetical protein